LIDPDAFNTVVFDRGQSIRDGYVTRRCFGEVCVAQREASCSPGPIGYEMPSPRPLGDWLREFKRRPR